MVGGSNGYRAALVRRQLTPGLISSLPGTAGLPPFICFSTSYPELAANLPRALTHPTLAYKESRGKESRGSARSASTLPRGLRRFNVLGETACLFGIATTVPASLGVFRARRQAPAMALMTSSTPPRGWPIESLPCFDTVLSSGK